MKLLIDMNLSPQFVALFDERGIETIHWLDIGDKNAPDTDILSYAQQHHYIILTHDLDFGAILAASQDRTPSVLQLRTQDILPSSVIGLLVKALRDFKKELEAGALVSIDQNKARVRILPLD